MVTYRQSHHQISLRTYSIYYCRHILKDYSFTITIKLITVTTYRFFIRNIILGKAPFQILITKFIRRYCFQGPPVFYFVNRHTIIVIHCLLFLCVQSTLSVSNAGRRIIQSEVTKIRNIIFDIMELIICALFLQSNLEAI